MPLDALFLSALKNELTVQIHDAKITKVQQPERDMIILTLKGISAQPHRLLISVGSGDARVHLTAHKFDNQKEPPMFCMLLRKHIVGAKITSIVQPQSERVLIFVLEAMSAIGVKSEKKLITEFIGRQLNIILCDNNDIIIDCLRRTYGELDNQRTVLPGLIYREPTRQVTRQDPLNISGMQLEKLIQSDGNGSIEKWLNTAFSAFSPLICREITYRAYGNTGLRFDEITDDAAAVQREFFVLTDRVNRSHY